MIAWSIALWLSMPANVFAALNGSQVCATQMQVDQKSIRDLCYSAKYSKYR